MAILEDIVCGVVLFLLGKGEGVEIEIIDSTLLPC